MIRKAIVGMMKRLRIEMSLRPRAMAADFTSSLVITLRRSLADRGTPRGGFRRLRALQAR